MKKVKFSDVSETSCMNV